MDSTAEYLDSESPINIGIGAGVPFSTSQWVNMTAASQTTWRWWMAWVGNGYGIGLVGGSNAWGYYRTSALSSGQQLQTAGAPDGWHHCATSFDGTNTTFYRDGVASSPVATTSPAFPNATLTIGGHGGEVAQGYYTQVAMFNRALAAHEVAELRYRYPDEWVASRNDGTELLLYLPMDEADPDDIVERVSGVGFAIAAGTPEFQADPTELYSPPVVQPSIGVEPADPYDIGAIQEFPAPGPSTLDLAASLTSSSSATVALELGLDLAAALSTSSSLLASLDRGVDLAAALSTSSVVSVDLGLTITIAATTFAASSLAAALDLSPAAIINLAAALSTSSSLSAAVDLGVDLAAPLASSSVAAAALDLVNDLAAALAGGSTITVDLDVPGALNLAAALSSGSTLSAALDLENALAASLSSSSTIVAALDRGVDLAAALSSDSSVVVALSLVNDLAAILTSSSAILVNLDTGEILGVRSHRGYAVCRLEVSEAAVCRLRVVDRANARLEVPAGGD